MIFSASSPYTGLAFFIAGLLFGSFGNVLIYRLPQGKSILGWSACPRCHQKLKSYDLIPVLSFLLLGGKCRFCKQKISMQYPLVELSCALLFFGTWFSLAPTHFLILILMSLSLWLLLLIAIIDAQTQMIPDVLTVILFFLGAAITLGFRNLEWYAPLIALGFFGLQWILSRGTWIGTGDLFLAVAIGMLLGTFQFVVLWILLTYIIGGIVAGVLLLSHTKSLGGRLAFAPFLAVSAILVLFFGDKLIL